MLGKKIQTGVHGMYTENKDHRVIYVAFQMLSTALGMVLK